MKVIIIIIIFVVIIMCAVFTAASPSVELHSARVELLAAFPAAGPRFQPSLADLAAVAERFDGQHQKAASALANAMLAKTVGRVLSVIRKTRCVNGRVAGVCRSWSWVT